MFGMLEQENGPIGDKVSTAGLIFSSKEEGRET